MTNGSHLNEKNEPIELKIASPADREGCVAELWLGNKHMGEVYLMEGELFLDIYVQDPRLPWTINLENLMEALGKAKTKI